MESSHAARHASDATMQVEEEPEAEMESDGGHDVAVDTTPGLLLAGEVASLRLGSLPPSSSTHTSAAGLASSSVVAATDQTTTTLETWPPPPVPLSSTSAAPPVIGSAVPVTGGSAAATSFGRHSVLLGQLRRRRELRASDEGGGQTWPPAQLFPPPTDSNEVEAWLRRKLLEIVRRKSARWGIDFTSDPSESVLSVLLSDEDAEELNLLRGSGKNDDGQHLCPPPHLKPCHLPQTTMEESYVAAASSPDDTKGRDDTSPPPPSVAESDTAKEASGASTATVPTGDRSSSHSWDWPSVTAVSVPPPSSPSRSSTSATCDPRSTDSPSW